VKMLSHTMEFRLLADVESRKIYVASAYAGQSHIIVEEDVYLSRVYNIFRRWPYLPTSL